MLWVLVFVLPAVLLGFHVGTHGRSSPLAALAFIVIGPILGVVLLLPVAAKNTSNSGHAGSKTWGKIYGLDLDEYCLAMTVAGLVAAICAAGIFAGVHADEFRHYHADPKVSLPRPMSSAALAALGLNAGATLEDIEQAYRNLAKHAHPDGGGDNAQFKRLHANYERAKKYVARTRRNCGRQSC
jgi:hypothetical protein